MKLNICMLIPIRYGPNMRVNPQIGIFSHLSHFGHEITWILSSENSRITQKIARDGIRIYAAPYIHYLNEHSRLAKVINLIPATFKKVRLALKVFRENDYDLIFIREDTFDGLLGVYLRRKYKIPLVYELTDPLEQEWEGSKIEGDSPLFLWYLMAKIKASLKIYIMKKADLVLPTTRWFEEGLAEKGISKSKLLSFPNGVDPEYFSKKDGKSIREKYNLRNSKVIIYVGAMAKMRKLSILINAFSKVNGKIGNVKLLMVGDGTGRQNLERLAAELDIRDNVVFTGQIHQSKIPNYIATADIGVSLVPPSSFYKVSSPIKMLEYMAMAKPVVANEEIHEHDEIIKQSDSGILVPFTSEAFANAIIELLGDPEMIEEMGRRGYKWVIENRSYEILAHKLEGRCSTLL